MSVLNPNSDEEPLECPLCMEYLELDDINFFPCSCGYQICRFCWNRLRVEGNGLCPACRGPYSENPADFKPLTRDDMAKIKAEKRQKDQAKKQKVSENRKHLANVRVVQKNLVFVVGLSPRLSDAEVLRKHEYFGKFGKIHKVVINTSTAYAGNQNQGPSASAYVTYYRSDDALRAIQVVNNIFIDGRTLKASLGTTKYCSHFMKNQPCPKPDCMYLHELGDEAASFTKEEMQQGKHTEYEKNLHEEMINNESSSSSSGGGGSHSTTTTTTTAATSGGSGTTNTLTTTTNGHLHHQPNQRAPTTTTTTPGDKQTNDNSRINSNLNDNDTSNSAPPGKQKQRQSSGTAGHSRNVIVTNNLNSTKSPPQQPPPPASTPPTPSGEQALTNGVMASSRTPSPKSGVSSGSSVTSSSQGGGGSDGGSNQLMSNSSTASVTSSASSGSTSSAMSASVPVSGLPVSRSGDVEGASPSERCWPPTSSTSNTNSSDGVNSVPTSASLSRDYPHRDEESPIDFASQLSNSGEATSSGMGSQTAKTDLPPSLDPIHRGQTPTEHQSSIATDIRDQGSWDHLVSRTVDHPTGGLQLKETDDMFGGPEDDGLGFDPFHETQKALAEMLESESNDWPGPSPVNQLHQPVQQGSVSASGDSYPTSQIHQSSFGGSQQQQQQSSRHTPQSTAASTTAPPPGLGGPPTNRAATSGGGAKQPPPGFNMMNAFGSSSSSQNVPNLLSEMHGFGGLDSFAGSGGNSGHIGNVNGFHGGNGRETDGFGFGSTHHNPHPSHARFGGLGQTHPRNPSGGSGGLHGFPPHHSQSDVVNRSRPDSGSSSGGGNALDHLQQQFRQMAMQQQQHHQHPDSSSNKVANSKDWQEGFRALLPNVNVSFGALPGSGGGGSNGSQVGHHESVTHSSSGRGGSDRLHYGDMPEGSSRFNNLPTSSSSSNGGVGQQLSGGNSHNMLNEVLGVIPGGGSAALNGHLDRALHHQHHHQQQNIRQNSGWHGLGGGHGGSNHSNHGGNDWGVMDPAIVGAGGQLSGDGGHGGGGHHGVHGGGHHQSHHNHHQARADSPPNWIKANLEQLTSDSGSTGFNLLGGGGGGHNAFSLASPPPPPGGNPHAPSSQHRCEVQQQGGGNGGLAGWLANTPPPGFSLNSRTLAHQQAAQQQQNQHVPFSLSGVGGPAGAVNASDLESEFQRLIHSK